MSILRDAYKLCKEITQLEERLMIKNALSNIQSDDKYGGNALDYLARRHGLQVLSYLIIEQSHDQNYLMISQLPQEMRLIFEQWHMQLQILNNLCLRNVLEYIPACRIIADPYANELYQIEENHEVNTPLSIDIIEEFTQTFQQHPAIQNILSLDLDLIRLNEQSYIDNFNFFSSLFGDPNELFRLILSTPRKSPQQLMVYHILTILCLRDAISNLDQLLFQAMYRDRLPILNEDNIIQISGRASDILKNTITITYQTNDQVAPFLEPNNLVLVKVKETNYPIDGLFRVNNIQYDYSHSLGERNTVEMYEIDENLSCYSNLLQLMK
jgi:hypothetical protein